MQTLWLMCLKINWECNSYSCIFVWDQVWIKIVVKKVLLFSSTFLHGSLAKSNKNSVSGIKILAYDIARPEEPGINHSKILFWHLLDQNKFYPKHFVTFLSFLIYLLLNVADTVFILTCSFEHLWNSLLHSLLFYHFYSSLIEISKKLKICPF